MPFTGGTIPCTVERLELLARRLPIVPKSYAASLSTALPSTSPPLPLSTLSRTSATTTRLPPSSPSRASVPLVAVPPRPLPPSQLPHLSASPRALLPLSAMPRRCPRLLLLRGPQLIWAPILSAALAGPLSPIIASTENSEGTVRAMVTRASGTMKINLSPPTPEHVMLLLPTPSSLPTSLPPVAMPVQPKLKQSRGPIRVQLATTWTRSPLQRETAVRGETAVLLRS